MRAHTPGQRNVAHAGFERKVCVVARRAGRPVTVAMFDSGNKDEDEANARLDVAAPELLVEHTAACDASDHILAIMTMEFGRLMVEAPNEEIELTMCGHTVRIPAHQFNRLYNATTRRSIAKASA